MGIVKRGVCEAIFVRWCLVVMLMRVRLVRRGVYVVSTRGSLRTDRAGDGQKRLETCIRIIIHVV